MMNKPEKFILCHQGSVERISTRNELNLGKQLLIKGGWVNKTGSLEKASHLSKDVGELGAAIGAIQTFMGVFNESANSQAFGYVF